MIIAYPPSSSYTARVSLPMRSLLNVAARYGEW
jgi:hypothetical protein